MMTKKQGKRGAAAGIALSLACLAAIFLFIKPAQIWAAMRTARYSYLLLGSLSMLGFMALRAVRWRFLLSNSVSLARVFHVQNIGYTITYLLPLRLGDVARGVMIGQVPPLNPAQGLSTMVVERVLDLLVIVLLLPLALLRVGSLPPESALLVRGAGILAGSATLLLILAANQRPRAIRASRALFDRLPRLSGEGWAGRVEQLLAGLESLRHWRTAMPLLGLSLLVWLPMVLAHYWVLRAVQLPPSLSLAAFITGAAALTIAAPSSPGQVGVFHAGVIAALTQVAGQPQAASASFAFLYHALNFVTIILLGVIGMQATRVTFGRVVALARRSTAGIPAS